MTKPEKECVLRALEWYQKKCEQDYANQNGDKDALEKECRTVTGLRFMFLHILNSKNGATKV